MGRITKKQETKTKNRIVALAEEGMTAPEIAEALELSTATVYRYRDRFHIDLPNGRKGRKADYDNGRELVNNIRFLAASGISSSDIASRMNTPEPVIKAIVKKHEIPIDGS